MAITTSQRRSPRMQALLQFGLLAGILLFANLVASVFYTHLDLTEEKRFTLTQPTRQMLSDLKERVYVQVLLEGEFPAGFKRLQTATREMLDDFRSESGLIDYQFEDPSEGSVEDINNRRKVLAEMGVNPVNLRIAEQGEQTQKLIYPVAIFNFNNRQLVVKLLENESPSLSPDEVINNSVSLLEYKFANAIKKIQSPRQPMILFTEGHGELTTTQTADLEKSLDQFYEVGHVRLDSVMELPTQATLATRKGKLASVDTMRLGVEPVALLVVAKPRTAFTEKAKFVIDQYVMNGGKVLWMIDGVAAALDSLRGGRFVPSTFDLKLEDQLYKYGVRIQPDLVADMECSKIPLQTGQLGNAPQLELFGWYFHPTVRPSANHPIVKNLDRVELQFCSSIDTIRTKTAVKKTVILRSSKYSRLQFMPMEINFDILRYSPDPKKFDKGEQAVGVLLEGVFPSNYENRVSAEMANQFQQAGVEFKKESVPTRMLVISDGDVGANHVRINEQGEEQWLPLGFNRFEKRAYANKELMLNAVEYLIDATGVIEARSREVKLRLLDSVRARDERLQWQLLNIGVPLLFLGGFAWWFRRRRRQRYARQ
jgi:ABC-2 type transport system permease protein